MRKIIAKFQSEASCPRERLVVKNKKSMEVGSGVVSRAYQIVRFELDPVLSGYSNLDFSYK